MSAEVRELVDRRWAEYGIPETADAMGKNGAVARRLRQLVRR